MHLHPPRLTTDLAVLNIGLERPATGIETNCYAFPAAGTADLGFRVPGIWFCRIQRHVIFFRTRIGGCVGHHAILVTSEVVLPDGGCIRGDFATRAPFDVPFVKPHPRDVLSVRAPAQLKLELVPASGPFVLDIEGHVGWQPQALARHLNRERRARLKGVGEAPELSHELRPRVGTLEVTATITMLSHETPKWRKVISRPNEAACPSLPRKVRDGQRIGNSRLA